jgi:acetyl/propionyl-CoA carboxylase alpha subunit/acetyl-CoA carboxylase carboxyltransferase component
MSIQSLLIANRGEIAIRIARACAELGIRTVGVYAQDDVQSLHVRQVDRAIALQGAGPKAYLDIQQLLAAARTAGCTAVHPGYGFLSENPVFARTCRQAGFIFVGPRTELLEQFGNKTQARSLAQRLYVPILLGTLDPVTVEEAAAFLRSLGPGRQMLIKANAGGGGRGMRVVSRQTDLSSAFARCQSEATTAFGSGELYVEEYFTTARHIEVQVIGDSVGNISHLWERECTAQRRHQKVVEMAPSPSLSEPLREELLDATMRMAREVKFDSLGTFEFMVDARGGANARYVFIEANARLQVEHTVTEEVLGIDLVRSQLLIAGGASLAQLGLEQESIPKPRGTAMQLRINMETLLPDGSTQPASGALRVFEPPAGPGIRVDSCGYAGYQVPHGYDSLLAKLIVRSTTGQLTDLSARAYRALCEFRIDGIGTNIGLLQNLLRHADFRANKIDTQFVERHAAELLAGVAEPARRLAEPAARRSTALSPEPTGQTSVRLPAPRSDPMTTQPAAGRPLTAAQVPAVQGSMPVPRAAAADFSLTAVMRGTVIGVDVRPGDDVRAGQQMLVIESMKMEHVVIAPRGGRVRSVHVKPGMAVSMGTKLISMRAAASLEPVKPAVPTAMSPERIRPDLQQVLTRQQQALDAARPDAVARRRQTQQRTARENIADLCDADSFVEYGALAVAAQRARRSMSELIEKTPADGMVTGVGRINGNLFEEPHSRAAILAYDYTVLAGTQGTRNHAKTDRLLQIAQQARLPLVLFAEGGGGRPGDTEGAEDPGGTPTFARFAELSGLVPTIGIAAGRCFAGNAALLGCCDVVIATANSNIGMGGPAMIEGGGLGVVTAEQIGPLTVQLANGVVDIGVTDEAEAVKVARQYLAYFQGSIRDFQCADQRVLRNAIPENRVRVYDVMQILRTLSDNGWMLELRGGFARGMITALTRIEGRSVGVIANNSQVLGGAIDADGADKASRFMQLCDAYDIPLLFLCDTPGIMVGPEAERTGLVRHSSRMFLTGANLTVPLFTVVLRKAYGLGALAMSGGSFKRSVSTVAWPTGEFGGMGLEGAIKLAYRNELAQITNPAERRRKYEEKVAEMYEHGKALSMSSIFAVDDTIDPADTRKWLSNLLRSMPAPSRGGSKKRPAIDSW